jgi:hypothetical protein
VGILDVILGRSKQAKPDLDRLFALPSAAITLEAAAGFTPVGLGAVCFSSTEGGAFAQIERDVKELLNLGGKAPIVDQTEDDYGYTWLTVRHDTSDIEGVVTDVHAVNSALESNGFGPALLCSIFVFAAEDGRRLALIYLYKRGTFYPFAPKGGQRRDNALELQVRGAVGDDLPVEQDLSRWFPVWGAPGL